MDALNDFKLLNEEEDGNGDTILTFGATKEIIDKLKDKYGDNYEEKLQEEISGKLTNYINFISTLSEEALKDFSDFNKMMERLEHNENV